MNTHASPQQTSTPAPLAESDPRYAFAHVVDAVGTLIETTNTDCLANPTPCPDFSVKELLEHCVLVVRRVAAIGAGEHWSTITEAPTDSGWGQDYRTAAHNIMLAWQDPAILDKILEVPWGSFPGVALMYTYTAELAVHGWDLAHATNRPFTIDDSLLGGALVAMQMIPAEGRDDPDMPFSAVVDPGPDAPMLIKLAGWAGRNVLV